MVVVLAVMCCTCCASVIQPATYYATSRAKIDSVLYVDMGYWREEIAINKKDQKTETSWPFATAFVFIGLLVGTNNTR